MGRMYNFEVKTKLLVNGELWGYELISMPRYIDFPVIVKNSEFVYLVKAGFISRVKLDDAGNPVFKYKSRSFDSMRSRNLKTPPITGEYHGDDYCGFIKVFYGVESVLFVDGLYTDTSKSGESSEITPITDPNDKRILGYRLYSLNTHETYSFACFETHHLIYPFGRSTVLGLKYDGSFKWVVKEELAGIYNFTGLPVFDLAYETCELPSGGFLERTNLFRLRELNKVQEQVTKEVVKAMLTGETNDPIVAAVINYFADECN